MKSKQTVRPQREFCLNISLNVFFHELLVKVWSQSVVDETSLFLVDFAASAVLKNNVVVPSEHKHTHPTKHSVNNGSIYHHSQWCIFVTVNKTIKNRLTAMTLRDWKNNFRSFIYSPSSTNRANSLKIRPVDVEISGLTEINKKYK